MRSYLTCGAVLGLLIWVPLRAAALPVSRFATTVIVAEDGSAVVVEQFDFPFVPAGAGPKPLPLLLRGQVPQATLQRRLRISTPGPLGTRHMLFVRVFGLIVDDNRHAPYSARTRGDFLEINIPVSPGANHRVEIRYLVKNAVRFLADRDELYWTAVNDFGRSIPSASMQVVLPPPAAGQFRAQGFVAGGAQVLPLTAEVDRNSATFDASGFPNGMALTADLVLPKGLLSQPNALRRAGWFLRANLIVLLPAAVFAFMFWLWRKKSRNYLPGLSVAPRYEPPAGLTPAEVGTLIDDRIDPRDVVSTLVDLAVRGYVRIEEAPHQEGHAPDYKFYLLKPREEWGGLAAHERTMLLHTFYGGHWTMLSSLRLRFYSVVEYMKADIFAALKSKGMYRISPEAAPRFRWIGFVAIVVLLLVAEALGLVSLYQSLFPATVAVAASAVIVFLFGRRMSAKTFRGMRACSEILGFQEFISSVEGDRLRQMEPRSFERFLPYAMALGIEHRWANAFHGIADPPTWYQVADSGLLDSILFGEHLNVMAGVARSLMSARPRGASL